MEPAFLRLLQELSPILALLLLGGAWLVRHLVKQVDALQALVKAKDAAIAAINEARLTERDRDREVLRDVAGILERVQVDVREHDGRMTQAMRDHLDTTRQHISDQISSLRP